MTQDNPAPKRPATLGAYVRAARKQAGLSQRQLAAEVGVAFSNISRLETDTQKATTELLKRIADTLDLDLADLLAYQGIELRRDPPNLPTYLRRHYGELPAEAIAEVEAAITHITEKYQRRGDT